MPVITNIHRTLEAQRLPEDSAALLALAEFLQVLRILRQECPWDREQTHASLRPMLIEEAYEVVEAIDQSVDTGEYTELKKELGDLLLHILFHSEIGREEGCFSLKDVVIGEQEKLIYRHPHVFGEGRAETAVEVSANWEQLKRRELGRNSVLDGVPASLPALQRATRIQERAANVGFDWAERRSVWKKVREEVLELDSELEVTETANSSVDGPAEADGPARARQEDEFGDVLFSLVNVARHYGLDAEQCLRQATKKFERRFRGVERVVDQSGKPFTDYGLDELDAIWDDVKREERNVE